MNVRVMLGRYDIESIEERYRRSGYTYRCPAGIVVGLGDIVSVPGSWYVPEVQDATVVELDVPWNRAPEDLKAFLAVEVRYGDGDLPPLRVVSGRSAREAFGDSSS